MSDAAVVETPQHDTSQSPVGIKPREGVTVVDNTNFSDYVDSKVPAAPVADDAEPADTPEAKAAAELKEVQKQIDANNAPKEGDTNADGDMFLHGKWQDKRSFAYRLHMGTQEKVKEADAKIAEASANAKTEREAREKLERENNELRQKYEPPQQDLGPEPLPEQFSNVAEYTKAIKEWTAESVRKEERDAVSRQQAAKSWNDRQDATKKELPDYAEKIANSDVKVSDQLRDAIVESELGPRILYHLAENPQVATDLGKMPVAKMLREVGKLEAKLGSTEKPVPKSEEKTVPLAEISKAPAPITPLRGASAPVSNGIGADGQFHGTFEEYKARRLAGKIK